jgi:hypothetical protein
MSAGMAYEAMNNAGAMDSRLIVILNDNDMSIAPPVGAMSSYLARLFRPHLSLIAQIGGSAHHLPKFFEQKAARTEEFARSFDRRPCLKSSALLRRPDRRAQSRSPVARVAQRDAGQDRSCARGHQKGKAIRRPRPRRTSIMVW